MNVKRTKQADEDLITVWLYIAQDNLSAADAMLDKFDKIFSLLAENPKMGRKRDDIQKGLRYFPVGNYLILYRLFKKEVHIVRVLHSAKNLSAKNIEDIF